MSAVQLSPLETRFIDRHLTMGCLMMLLVGCAGTKIPVTTVHQDTRSAVFIETVSDKSFRAAHPIKVDEATVANVLRGMHTKPKTELLLLVGKALRTTDLGAAHTFFEDDIELLSPHLTEALAQAAPNQRIGFRLSYPPSIPTPSRKRPSETTGSSVSSSLIDAIQRSGS